MNTLRIIGPPALALAAVLVIDVMTRRRGLEPPGFRLTASAGTAAWGKALARHAAAMTLLWAVLWVGVFGPLGSLGLDREMDLSRLTAPQLFLLHVMFVGTLAAWYLLGFVKVEGHAPRRADGWVPQLGLQTPVILGEIGLGLVVGVAAWLSVLGVLVGIGMLVWWIGGEDLLPRQPPDLIFWLAALPVWLRVAVSLSAGIVEEAFFRGFLQPRVGVALSTMLFVLAHASYEQPLMLVGITLLSLIYATLVRWRQNIWSAVAAHALFDAVQLLVVIPTALRFLSEKGERIVVPVASVTGIWRAFGGS